MNLVAGAVGSLVPKLLTLLGDEYNLQKGVKKSVESLSKELKCIHTFLSKVSNVQWDQLDEQVQEWASEIREASYDMEDIIDTFLVRIEGREPTGQSKLKRAMNKMANMFSFSKGKARHDVGSAIQDIMKKLKEVADRHARYKIDDLVVKSSAATSTFDPCLKAMYKEVASLVGIEEPSKNLISMLSARGDDVARRKKIVSVAGTGGLGKTTLAKVAYEKLKADFDCGAFVPVGRNPSLRKVLMDILYELDKNKYADIHTKNRDERQLIDNIRDFLMNKRIYRYFIVIDDLWETKSWLETIELALLENNCGSRIIITTRNSQVSNKIGDEVYKIQPLSDDNSKKLFYARIFGDENKCVNKQSDEISNKITKKCGGIPLALITMASLLVRKPRERWSDVFTSIGFGHNVNEQVENTMKILSFSYYDMPSYLRTCLLYLSVFPEDYTIDKDSLIWKWIAEGFIQEPQGISLFELGERYFNDLIHRSMIQTIEAETTGMVEGCRIHDMVLDFICSLSSKENFATTLDSDEGLVSPVPRCARRIAQHNSTMEHATHANVVGMPQLRSFICYRCDVDKLLPLSSFKILRVLAMEGCKNVSSSHLVHLGNLLHMRYLGLENTKVEVLPDEVGTLKLLQALNLAKTQIRQLTPSISWLTQLVCLKGDFRYTIAPWIQKLTSLEELQVSMLFLECNKQQYRARVFLKERGSLTNLRVLRIFNDREEMDDAMQRDLVLSLRDLHQLQHLKVNFFFQSDANADTWEEAGFVLPQHLKSLDISCLKLSFLPSFISAAYLPNLTHLSLFVNAMDEKGMGFIGRLPELRYHRLLMKSTVTLSNIGARKGYFQQLRFCVMHCSMIQFRCKEENSSVSFHIWNGIDDMPFGSGKNDCSIPLYAVMPNLEVLESLIFVRALKDGNGDFGNTGLQYLPSLQEVKVYMNCVGVSAAEVNEAEATLRKATEVHPNRPTLTIWKENRLEMISAVREQKSEEED